MVRFFQAPFYNSTSQENYRIVNKHSTVRGYSAIWAYKKNIAVTFQEFVFF